MILETRAAIRIAGACGVVAGLWLSAGCEHSKPNFTYMPDMAYSPAFKAQEEGAMRQPVAGTVPRGHVAYAYASEEEAGAKLQNPLRRTRANLEKGREMYNIYCAVCHGPAGEGDGSIVPKFPRPPSLQTERVAGFPDGRLHYLITKGRNLMPSYASQVPDQDRWAIIHYLRVLYRSKHPTPDDLKALEKW